MSNVASTLTTLAMEYCWFSLSHQPIASKNQNCSVKTKSRIWEMKEHIKHAKTQVGAIFHLRDILRNVLLRFLVLCMRHLIAILLVSSEGHTPGSQKQTETSVTKVCYQANSGHVTWTVSKTAWFAMEV